MKIMHPEFIHNQQSLIRFIEEAQVGAQLQHPNIVPIYEMGVLPDGRQYFTRKEIRGIECSELIHDVHAASTTKEWKPGQDGITFRRLIQIFHKMCETCLFSFFGSDTSRPLLSNLKLRRIQRFQNSS